MEEKLAGCRVFLAFPRIAACRELRTRPACTSYLLSLVEEGSRGGWGAGGGFVCITGGQCGLACMLICFTGSKSFCAQVDCSVLLMPFKPHIITDIIGRKCHITGRKCHQIAI